MAAKRQLVIISAEPAEVCSGCEYVSGGDNDEPAKVYECGDCGTEFTKDESADGDSNRCPDCNKFAAASENSKCPDCGDDLGQGFAFETEDGRRVGISDTSNAFRGVTHDGALAGSASGQPVKA